MAPSRGVIEDKDAKHLLDSIGEKVYNTFHTAALKYEKELHGHLSEAKFRHGNTLERPPSHPCNLNHNFHTNVRWGESYPCDRRSKERFSDEGGGECDDRKIKDSKNNGGACAPYRRLHLCDYNLEKITDTHTTTTHNLLVDVCLAAKYEGESLQGYHDLYLSKYPDTKSQLCTVLARSFADIGDIIRGKDLYLGNKKKRGQTEREKLEQKLKEIFKKIHDDVTKGGTNGQTLKTRYENDTINYFQLREDWWNNNRIMVWNAITCGVKGSHYFRHSCGSGKTQTRDDCRCTTYDVPTYFDYVPQFLRWFEEWAEDFCRLRKHKLENAIKNCRGEDGSGKERYCDLNGYNCKETARGAEIFVKGHNCHKCSVACKPFTNWIDNQKQEFEKQKGKYTKEINKTHDTTMKIGATTINNLYVDDFYKELKTNYGNVEEFLKKLNKEGICQKPPEVEDEKADTNYGNVEEFLKKLNKEGICQKPPEVEDEKADAADFTEDHLDKTFDHTEYCQACPLCGVKPNGRKWKRVDDMSKCAKKEEKSYEEEDTTTIPVLTPEKGKKGILQKYKKFCDNANDNNSSQIKNWQCHYDDKGNNDVKDDSDNCIEGEWKNSNNEQNPISYYSFFYGSIIEMLNDSIEWKDKLKYCINNKTGKCKNEKCKEYCECYKNWITQKKKELDGIKIHFRKQKDIEDLVFRDITLNITLNTNFLKDIEEAYTNKQQVEKIKSLLGEKIKEGYDCSNGKTIIDEFLDEEQKKAEECTQTHKETCPPPKPTGEGGAGESAVPSRPADGPSPDSPQSPPDHASNEDEDEDDEDDDDEESESKDTEVKDTEQEEAEKAKKATEDKVDGGSPTTPAQDKVNPCDIVQTLFSDTNKFKDVACEQKYGKTAPTSWKCVSSGNNTTTSGGSGDVKTTPSSGKDTGSVCVPPRRRKLYVTPLTTWADKQSQSQNGESSGEAQALSGGNTESSEKLRTAFIQSAAVETFFLWDRYKKENTRDNKSPLGGAAVPQLQPPVSNSDGDPQEELQKSGKIPPSFLRQMFYTLADYKDILFSGDKDNKNGYSDIFSGDNVIKEREEKIRTAINSYFSKSENQGTRDKNPQALWDRIAEHVWNGMICALTHKTETPGEVDDTVKEALMAKLEKETGKVTGEEEGEYHYSKVTLKEDENGGGPKPAGVNEAPPKLSDFVEIPTYFRYLHEWGETFCRERTKRLEQIKVDCEVDENGGGSRGGTTKQKYSGDGETCNEMLPQNDGTVPDLEKPSCAKPCSSYRKWIERKKTEYEKQKNAYKEQKTKCVNESNNHRNGFCGTVTTSTTAGDFLKTLTSCSKKDSESAQDEIKFDDDKTFKHTDYCDPCSKFIVKCENCNSIGGGTKVECNGTKKNSIDATDIENGVDSTVLDMRVSADSKSGFNGDGLENACRGAGIFEGIRKDEWKCRNVCGYVVCKPKNANGQKVNEKHIIQIRALVKRWLEYFLEDYNKIRKKLNPCINNGEKAICTNGCVEQWINQKRTEWTNMKKRFNEQYNGDDTEMKSSVKNFFEGLISQIAATIDKGNHTHLEKLVKSLKCKCAENSEKERDKDANKKDMVDCLLEYLDKKATSCPIKPSGENQANCVEKSTPDVEDDEPFEEVDQNPEDAKKMIPKICGKMDAQREQQEEKGGCEPENEKKKEKEKEEQDGDSSTGGGQGSPPAPAPVPVP
ncbi:hypothetical protein PFBG_06128 [Plasmodium falciparum 7G8]|uniref:Erythrocyte membrane protein 1 n=1 Tax=Plasmodium falciparum (isolate 7G8) TaxID=57266 RepID=W7FC97_PLAF8|nr:hypothetical protein PFBG_06128 [Plasmodium falciparum 7G8]